MSKITSAGSIRHHACCFSTGGALANSDDVSGNWIGRVCLYRPNEELPLDQDGHPMYPLFQIDVQNLPFVPDLLRNTLAITVFVAKNADHSGEPTKNGGDVLIREYKKRDELVVKELAPPWEWLTAHPLSARRIRKDLPCCYASKGDLYDFPWKDRVRLNRRARQDYLETLKHQTPSHKVGGFPTFIQADVDFGRGFEFAFQIASDEKAHLNIVDFGAYYFTKNKERGEWRYCCQFY